MGKSRRLFIFVTLQFKLKKRSVDVVLGIRTRDRRDGSTELCINNLLQNLIFWG